MTSLLVRQLLLFLLLRLLNAA